MEIEFENKWVSSRKNLIDFVSEHYKGDVLEEIGRDFKRWFDELGIIYAMVTGRGLCGVTGLDVPPEDDADFRKIGNTVFFYSGKEGNLRGLWLPKEVPDYSKGPGSDETTTSWTHYPLGSRARLGINKKFEAISIDDLLPENFASKNKTVKGDKRPIFRFKVDNNGIEEMIFAKGSQILESFYYDEARPSYRLTNIVGARKVGSKDELKKTMDVMEAGINTHEIVGVYTSDFEDFLFLKEVEGKRPDSCFSEHRDEMIRQDAVMLARLCKLGYRKQGFEDFDDKVFDGKDLYLIDVEDLCDIYSYTGVDFRKVLCDPASKNVRQFRNFQREFFITMLRDAVYNYRGNMLADDGHKRQYVRHFFNELGWRLSDKKIAKLLRFPKNYIPYSSQVSMMLDTD